MPNRKATKMPLAHKGEEVATAGRLANRNATKMPLTHKGEGGRR